MRYAAFGLALALGLLGLGCSRRSPDLDRPGTTRTTGARSDNTSMNERDRSGANPTPMSQGENQADLETTARIRQMLVADSNLSIDAKNVKIITSNGVVTLRGPVNDEHERAEIARMVAQEPGVATVDNQLEITGK